MIGMNQIKKRLINGILIGLGIGLVFVILTIILANNVVKGYENGTNKNFLENYTGMVVTFNRDVIQGEKITADMLLNTRVHKSTLPSDAASSGSIIGKIAKYNIPRNVTIVNSMFSDYIVGTDVRIQEISAILLPTNIAVNDYIDIRIMYPSGVEYVVLPQKQMKNIVGTTIWMDLSEEELLILNSALVDSYMTPGSKLYAVQYTDPTTQIKFSDSEMEQAKLYITEKIVAELNSVIKTAKVEKTTVAAAVDNVLTNDSTVNVYNESTPTTPTTTPTPVITQDKLVLNTGKIDVDQLISLVTKYAIEYRYYVESYNKVEANYQPNTTVMAFMKSDKYIVDQAKAKLSEDVRKSMENNVKAFEAKSGESYSVIVSGIQASIASQTALRTAVLAAQQPVTTTPTTPTT